MLDYQKRLNLYTEHIYITFDSNNRVIEIFYEDHFHYRYEYQNNYQRTRHDCYHNIYRSEYFNNRNWETTFNSLVMVTVPNDIRQ